MSNDNDYEARKQRTFLRLGTDKPACVICGESRWQCLELHHIAGLKHHDEVVIVCRNCHRVLSDAQRDHPPPQSEDSAIGRFLLGLADLLVMIAVRLKEFGLLLIRHGGTSVAGGAPS